MVIEECLMMGTNKFFITLTSIREEMNPNNPDDVKFYVGAKELSMKQLEAIKVGLIPDPFERIQESSKLDVLLNELDDDSDLFQEIVDEYKDILLSDNFIPLVREPEEGEDNEKLRVNLSKLVKYTMFLLQETQAYGAELEAQQLEIIRSICQVAMNPRYKTEQETAYVLQDKVRDMKPLLDDMFVAYLKYSIAEEEGRLSQRGLLHSYEQNFGDNQWLMVLQIVQAGVYGELAKGINRHLEHIWYVLRMETRYQRKELLSKLIDDMPTLDIRPFIKVVYNIASSLGSTAKGQFRDTNYELSKLTPKILQLSKDVHELLPPERIALKSRDADQWLKGKREGFLTEPSLMDDRGRPLCILYFS